VLPSFARYHLLNSKYSKAINENEAVYFDEISKKIIIKTISFSDEREIRLNFQDNLSSLNFRSSLGNLLGVKKENTVEKKIPNIKRFRSVISGLGFKSDIHEAFFKKFKPYKKIISRKNTAVYFDKEEGRIVFKTFQGKSNPDSLSFYGQQTNSNYTRQFKTIEDFYSKWKDPSFISKMHRFGLTDKNILKIFNTVKKQLIENSEKDLNYRSHIDTKKNIRYDIKYDHKNNFVYIYTYQLPNEKLLSKKRYDLNLSTDLKYFKSFVKRKKILSSHDVNSLLGLQTNGCNAVSLLEQVVNLSKFDDILGVLKNELDSDSISQTALINGNNIDFFIDIKGKNRKLSVSSLNGNVSIFPKGQLSIDDVVKNGQHYFHIKDKDGKLLQIVNYKKKSSTRAEIRIFSNRTSTKNPDISELLLNKFPVLLAKGKVKEVKKRMVIGSPLGLDKYPLNIDSVGNDVFLSTVFNSFKPSSKSKIVSSQVANGAEEILLTENSEFDEFTEKTIKQMSIQIAGTIKNKSKNKDFKFDNINNLKAMAYRESYLLFSEKVIKNMLSENLPDFTKQDIDDVLHKGRKKFKACLDRSVSQNNIESAKRCLQVFMTAGVHSIGQEIAEKVLKSKNIIDNKTIKKVRKQFSICFQENISELSENPKIKKSSIVKGCIIQSIAKNLDVIVLETVNLKLKDLQSSLGISTKLSSEAHDIIFKDSKDCLTKKGYLTNDLINEGVFDKVSNIEVDTFLKDVNTCVYELPAVIGNDIVKDILKEKLSDKIKFTDEELNDLLVNSYQKCINKQRELKYTALKPVLCEGIITLEAVKKVVLNSLDNELLAGVSANLKQSNNCFENEKKRLLRELEKPMSNSTLTNLNITQCVKESIVEGLNLETGNLLEKYIHQNPELDWINFTLEEKKLLNEELSNCFNENLSKIKNYYTIGDKVSEIQDICALKLLKHRVISKEVIQGAIKKALKDNQFEGLDLLSMTNQLYRDYIASSSKAKTLSEYLKDSADFSRKATQKAMKYMLHQRVKEAIDTMDIFGQYSSSKYEKKAKEVVDLMLNKYKFEGKVDILFGNKNKFEDDIQKDKILTNKDKIKGRLRSFYTKELEQALSEYENGSKQKKDLFLIQKKLRVAYQKVHEKKFKQIISSLSLRTGGVLILGLLSQSLFK